MREGGLAQQFPYLAALGNSLGAHYVYGTTVLAANAGHADAANEHAGSVAGHAIALAIPKVSFLKALEEAARGTVGRKRVVKPELLDDVAKARFDALYPEELRARIRPKEDPSTASEERVGSCAQLRYPSTRTCSRASSRSPWRARSRPRAPTRTTRRRAACAIVCARQLVATRLANITRTHKTLDSGMKGQHAFYLSYDWPPGTALHGRRASSRS